MAETNLPLKATRKLRRWYDWLHKHTLEQTHPWAWFTTAAQNHGKVWLTLLLGIWLIVQSTVTLMMSYCLLAPVALNIAEPVIRLSELCTAAAALSPPYGFCPRLLHFFIACLRKGAQGWSARTTCVFTSTKLHKLTQSIL